MWKWRQDQHVINTYLGETNNKVTISDEMNSLSMFIKLSRSGARNVLEVFQVFITNKWLSTHHWLQSYLFLAQMTPLIVTTVLSLKLVSLSLLFPDLVEVSTFDGRRWTPQVSMDFLNKITAIVAVLEKNKCVFIINKKPETLSWIRIKFKHRDTQGAT